MQLNCKTAIQLQPPPDRRAAARVAYRRNIVNILRSRPVAFACLALLALLAALPAPFRGRFATSGLVHACAHIAVFYLTFLVTVPRANNGRDTAILGCLLLSYGAALEMLQTLLFHIPLEYADVLADAAGVTLGIMSKSIAAACRTNQV
jgi:hypothetical protein